MLEKMKGQGQSMVAIAMKACAIAFKAVQRIGHLTKNYKIEWEYLPGALDITVADESREYEFVRGSFLFSPKACADSKAEDFSAPKELPINGKFVTTLDPWPLRMKTLELIGYYKYLARFFGTKPQATVQIIGLRYTHRSLIFVDRSRPGADLPSTMS